MAAPETCHPGHPLRNIFLLSCQEVICWQPPSLACLGSIDVWTKALTSLVSPQQWLSMARALEPGCDVQCGALLTGNLHSRAPPWVGRLCQMCSMVWACPFQILFLFPYLSYLLPPHPTSEPYSFPTPSQHLSQSNWTDTLSTKRGLRE